MNYIFVLHLYAYIVSTRPFKYEWYYYYYAPHSIDSFFVISNAAHAIRRSMYI